VVERDGRHQKIIPERIGLLSHAALARRGLVVVLAASGRAARLVALRAVRLVVVERVVELRRL